jgi:dephospho-CoA kinase
MIQAGLTGNIGSGKTTVAKIFRTLGIPVFQADLEAKKVLDNETTISKLLPVFGKKIIDPLSKKVSRKALAEIVFNNKEKLDFLNQIIHPLVRESYVNWVESHKNEKYILHEAAILIESGFYKMFDSIILVVSPEKLRLERVRERDNTTVKSIRNRMDKQMDETEKIRYADYIIKNNEEELLIPQVMKIHRELLDK